MPSIFIIAEAGVNHNGDLVLAKRLIDAAAAAGADAVKFQTFRAERIAAAHAAKADYQKRLTDGDDQLSMLKQLELSEADHHALIAHCQERGIAFLSTPFDIDSARLLRGLGLTTFKIPSGEITNLPLLREIAGYGYPVIVSTGMADLTEVGATIDALVSAGQNREHITLLHCTTEYPAPLHSVNLRAMQTMGAEFGLPIGYSDHTPGIAIPTAAAALGATVIEKHFTLDRTLPGPDHAASLEPDELTAMVAAIRGVEQALGNGVKQPDPVELGNRDIARKSLVAARAIQPGEPFSADNVTAKRPGTGISPMFWDAVMGEKANRAYQADELLDAAIYRQE
ncbi:N-acetylneuraminate synthase [Magnetofaba australis]|nr:N-acetylneuraminate synthase [Magnetofaba australis]